LHQQEHRMNAGLLYSHFAVLTPSGKVAWLTLLKTSCDVSLAALMHTLSCSCEWVLVVGYV